MHKFKLLIAVFSIVYSGFAYADVGSLSPELRHLLSKEMKALQGGMQKIIPLMASGDVGEIAVIARKIKHSYILSQQITQKQKHELHTKLPIGFIKLDQGFHNYAAKLEHAAIENDRELLAFYFYKMTESCMACHSSYAQHRFPKLSTIEPKIEHNH